MHFTRKLVFRRKCPRHPMIRRLVDSRCILQERTLPSSPPPCPKKVEKKRHFAYGELYLRNFW